MYHGDRKASKMLNATSTTAKRNLKLFFYFSQKDICLAGKWICDGLGTAQLNSN